MITPPTGFIAKMDSKTRNPTQGLLVSWNNTLLSGEWFRLDQSMLDSGAILTKIPYLDGVTITDFISDLDSKVYEDESAYVLMLEGYSEALGDNGQYSISDFDCELVNTNNRFTPRANKNMLLNPGYEDSKTYWNEINGIGANTVIDEDNPRTGIRALQLNNPSVNEDAMFSDPMALNDGSPIDFSTPYVFSDYIMGSGVLTMCIKSYDDRAIGNNHNITSGLLGQTCTTLALVSGTWSRPSVVLNVASGARYLKAFLSIASGKWARSDDGQVEQALVATFIDDEFIGDFILPKRLIKAEVGFSLSHVPKFAGLTDRIHPSTKGDTVQIHAYDFADRLKDVIIKDTYYSDKRSDEIIRELASLADIDSSKLSLEVGVLTIDFAYFAEGSIWYYMAQVAEAEGGRIFFDEEGILRFWSRTHYSTYTSPAYEFNFTDHIQDVDYEVSNSKVKNRIVVRAKPRQLLTNQKIFNDDTAQSLTLGENKEFFAQFAYRNELSVPALNVQMPVIGTNIKATENADGSGANLSAYLSISSSYTFRESMRVNLSSSYPGTLYVTTFNIYGDPIVIKQQIEQTVQDADSQGLYDVKTLEIENDLIPTDAAALALGTQRLAELKDPRDFITIEVVGVPYLQIGDKVRVQRSFDGTMEDMYIVRNKWQFKEDFVQTLDLEKKVIV
jgi:hypothetical protein